MARGVRRRREESIWHDRTWMSDGCGWRFDLQKRAGAPPVPIRWSGRWSSSGIAWSDRGIIGRPVDPMLRSLRWSRPVPVHEVPYFILTWSPVAIRPNVRLPVFSPFAKPAPSGL